MIDPHMFKADFPLLHRTMNGKPLVYLDNASTTQKPQTVLDAIADYYTHINANIHRGVYELSELATKAYEETRQIVADFIHASEAAEIIFTRNATEAFNLLAYTWGEKNIKDGDVIVGTLLEHHSNFVPWQELCRRKGATLKLIPLRGDGTLNTDTLKEYITEKTRLVTISHISNALGTIAPVEKILAAARAVGATTVIDAAQSAAHMPIDVQKLDCDFLAFSAHKMLGPTGVGVLYGRHRLLETMPPFLFGGDMVKEVTSNGASWNDVPWKFEAGTQNIGDVIAFQKALQYLEKIGLANILAHDQKLLAYARKKLDSLPKIQLYGTTDLLQSAGVLSFNIPGVHPHDVGSILNGEGVAIRTGHHCAQPLMQYLGVNATARMSFYFYNSEDDIDRAYDALTKVYQIFRLL